jgi:hypothetical protein
MLADPSDSLVIHSSQTLAAPLALIRRTRLATFGQPTAMVGNMRQVEVGFRLNF